MKIVNNTYSKSNGEITSKSEQTILGTERHYQTTYICKYCNAKFYTSYTKDSLDPYVK